MPALRTPAVAWASVSWLGRAVARAVPDAPVPVDVPRPAANQAVGDPQGFVLTVAAALALLLLVPLIGHLRARWRLARAYRARPEMPAPAASARAAAPLPAEVARADALRRAGDVDGALRLYADAVLSLVEQRRPGQLSRLLTRLTETLEERGALSPGVATVRRLCDALEALPEPYRPRADSIARLLRRHPPTEG